MFLKPKPAKQDYVEDMLPQTRKQVFFDVLKLHWGKLLFCGLIILVFLLPLHISAIYQSFYELSVMDSFDKGNLTTEEAYNTLRFTRNLASGVNILLYMLFSVGLAGLARIIKRFAWEEHVKIGGDFFKGIKQNCGQYMLLSLFSGAVVFICSFITDTLNVGTGAAYYVGIAATVLCAVVFLPLMGYMLVTISVYGIRFSRNIRYALILYGKNILKTLLAAVICFIPFVLQLIPFMGCVIAGRIISSILIPYIMLGWFLFAFNMLDKNINKENYPELVGKGLFIPKKEISNEN